MHAGGPKHILRRRSRSHASSTPLGLLDAPWSRASGAAVRRRSGAAEKVRSPPSPPQSGRPAARSRSRPASPTPRRSPRGLAWRSRCARRRPRTSQLTDDGQRETINGPPTGRFSVQVKLPASLKEGTYFVRAVRRHLRQSSAGCRFTTRKLTVKKATTPAPGRPTARRRHDAPGQRRDAGRAPRRREPGGTGTRRLFLSPNRATAGLRRPRVHQGRRPCSTTAAVDALTELGEATASASRPRSDSCPLTPPTSTTTRPSCSSTRPATSSTTRSRPRSRPTSAPAAASSASAPRSTPSRSWDVLRPTCSARAPRRDPTTAKQATIKVADRGHDASASAAGVLEAHRPLVQLRRERPRPLARARHGRREHLQRRHDGALDRPPDRLVQGLPGRPLLLHGRWAPPPTFADADFRKHLGGARSSGRPAGRPGLQRLRRDRARQLPADEDLGAAEPQRADRLRPAARRPHHADRPRRPGAPARPGQAARRRSSPTLPVYTNSEDGLYGPAIDNDFATNKWVYLYYAPPTVSITKCDGTTADVTTADRLRARRTAADPCVWQDHVGRLLPALALQVRRRREPVRWTSPSEQKIIQVANNRGACCHVAGDIDFDKHNNLWLVTGDDTPAGGGNSGGFSPHNDSKTDEFQTIRVNNATGGTFTLTFNGQTTAPIAVQRDRGRDPGGARGARATSAHDDIDVTGNAINARRNQTVAFDGQLAEQDVPPLVGQRHGLTGTGADRRDRHHAGGRPVQRAARRRPAHGAEHQRPARQGAAHQGQRRRLATTIPRGNLFPRRRRRKTRPEIYAMGFRNPFRIQVDDERRRLRDGLLAGLQRARELPRPGRHRPRRDRPQAVQLRLAALLRARPAVLPVELQRVAPAGRRRPSRTSATTRRRARQNTSRWNTGRRRSDYARRSPSRTSGTRTATTRRTRRSARRASRTTTAPGGTCPQLFPELFTGGVAPHGAAQYEFDAANPSETKFPPYYDGSCHLRRVRPGHAARDPARHAGQDLQDQPDAQLRPGASQPHRLPFECDNPMDMQFGADGDFYLLTYGDGFFAANAGRRHVQVGVRQGPARADGRAHADRDRRSPPR